jgi:GTP cyclohydrolase I
MAKQKRVVKMPARAIPGLAIEDSSFAPLIRKIIEQLVDDPDREGLTRTPERVEKALRFLTSGSSSSACASTTCFRSSAKCTWLISPKATSSALAKSPAS